MRNNETGEFELVVGNRQLLSGFAIVVLLFGVGVAMGYILGQNSPRSAKLQADAASVPPLAESRPQPASPAAPAQTQAASPAPGATADSAATQPSTPSGTPVDAPPTQPATQPARDSAPPAATAAAPAPVVAAANPIPEAPPGSYWQVMAVPQADAEVVMRVLKEQGFPALISPGTKNLTRVLVGPYKDTQAMGKAKTQLEGAGFHPQRKPID